MIAAAEPLIGSTMVKVRQPEASMQAYLGGSASLAQLTDLNHVCAAARQDSVKP
jgi:hypothetical protein